MKKLLIVLTALSVIFLLTGCPSVINYTPELEIEDQTVTEGQTLRIDLSECTYDRNLERIPEEALKYELISGRGEIADNNYLYTPGYTEEGTYTVQLKVTDRWGSVASDAFELVVIGANATPTIDIPEPPAANEGDQYMLDLSQYAIDLDLDEISFELLTDEGTITGNSFVFNPEFTDAGIHTVTIRVTDPSGAYCDYTFQIEVLNVNRAPLIDSIEAKTIDENSELNFTVSASDPDGDTLKYSLEGPGSLSGNNYSWTPGYDKAGTYDATVTVTDGEYSAATSFTITVNDVNRAPVINISNKSILAMETLNLDLTDYATDLDNDSLTFSVTSGVGSISGYIYTYDPEGANLGDHSATIRVSDDKGLFDDSTFTIEVIDCDILIIRDVYPWGIANAIGECLEETGITEYVYRNMQWVQDLEQLPAGIPIIIEACQPLSFYDAYKNNKTKFNNFVNEGGNIFWIASENVYKSGVTPELPGGIMWRRDLDDLNKVIDTTANLTKGLKEILEGGSASHGGFVNLDDPSVFATIGNLKIYMEENTKPERYPTYITYSYGSGRVVATTCPLEYPWDRSSFIDRDYWIRLLKRSLEYIMGMPISSMSAEGIATHERINVVIESSGLSTEY